MEATLEQFVTTGVFAFILTFVRIGTFVMLMPGIGDGFVPGRIRLAAAMAMVLVLSPVTAQYLPAQVPQLFTLVLLIGLEFLVGLFLGTIARIFMLATDTAGMVIATMSGLGSAQVLNPALSTQGSIIGAFLSVTGAVVIFSTDLHHLLIMGAVQSYENFPVSEIPDIGSMAEFVSLAVSKSFAVGVKMGAPFMVLTLLTYAGMGVLSRVMPQIQVFMVALPLQIILSLILLALVLMALMAYWAGQFEESMVFILG